ncbi:hypothetical protein BH11PLA1_BH11PLA1_18080 [soil metagenome]
MDTAPAASACLPDSQSLDRRLLLGAAGLAGVAALSRLSQAGPLAPPAGPVTSTSRPLGEIEPRTPIGPATTPGDATSLYRITQPGSYYLTGNIQGVAGKHGILIAASDVTLDLNGFTLRGVGGASQGFSGIAGDPAFARTVLRNGTIVNWDFYAVALSHSSSHYENLCAADNVAGGIATSDNGSCIDCRSINNPTGFSFSAGTSAHRCHASGSAFAGFNVFTGCVLTDCTAHASGTGFRTLAAGVVFRGCAAANNLGSGFEAGSNASLHMCSATSNTIHGITASSDSHIAECMSCRNGQHGISAFAGNHLHGNTCTSNGLTGSGYGINVTGTHNRLDGNHCTSNTQGIVIAAAPNLLVRNSVGGNSGNGYNITSNNGFGPNIFSSAGITSSGNPHANYEF